MKKIYLDTSVPSNYYDTRPLEQVGSTRIFWEEILPKFQAHISPITLEEIQSTANVEKRDKILKLVKDCQQLKSKTEIEAIAQEYIEAGLIPNNFAADALHIAYASFYQMDFLVTWNIRHLANPQKRKQLTEFNIDSGLHIPDLTTPKELIETYEENE